MSFLAAEALHFAHGHSFNANVAKGIFNFLQFEWFDDGFDFLHSGWRKNGLDVAVCYRFMKSPART